MVDDIYLMKMFPILVAQVPHRNRIYSMYKFVLNHLYQAQYQNMDEE